MSAIYLTTTQILGVAAIHASAMSIFAGVLGLYLVYHHRRQHELREEVFKAIQKINELPAPSTLVNGGLYDARLKAKRTELLDRLIRIALGTQFDALPPEDDHYGRGKELLKILSSLASAYPFPNALKAVGPGSIKPGSAEALTFADLDDVRAWLREVESLHHKIEWIWTVGQSRFSELFEAVQEEYHERIFERVRKTLARLSGTPVADLVDDFEQDLSSVIVAPFLQRVTRAAEIATETRRRLDTLEVYESQQPHWAWLVVAASLLGLGFIAGVILPLVWKDLPFWILVGIPVGIYGVGLLGLVVLAVRITR